jgi:hypothetical protein
MSCYPQIFVAFLALTVLCFLNPPKKQIDPDKQLFPGQHSACTIQHEKKDNPCEKYEQLEHGEKEGTCEPWPEVPQGEKGEPGEKEDPDPPEES